MNWNRLFKYVTFSLWTWQFLLCFPLKEVYMKISLLSPPFNQNLKKKKKKMLLLQCSYPYVRIHFSLWFVKKNCTIACFFLFFYYVKRKLSFLTVLELHNFMLTIPVYSFQNKRIKEQAILFHESLKFLFLQLIFQFLFPWEPFLVHS